MRALEYIRLNATSSGTSVDAVAKAMGCSRRLATMRFREKTGKTITEAIVERRLEKAMSLLRDPWRTLGSIANFCGYDSESYMKKIFKRATGVTMREWRRQNAAGQV
jgi:two-component system response regulator YesN